MSKAVVMYKPQDLRFEEVEIPTPKEDEVLLKIMAVGVCGSDIPRLNKFGAHTMPLIPGHEFSGEVAEITNGSSGFKKGDRVTVAPLIPCYQCKFCKIGEFSLCDDYLYYGSSVNGAFAQFIAVKQNNLIIIPDNISFEAAATVDPLANALHGLKQGGFEKGKSLCVYGAGPIGLYMIQAARAMGANNIAAVDITDDKLAVAMKCGADQVFNGLDSDVSEKVFGYFNHGADIVADVSGSQIAQHNAIMSAGKLGRVVLVGISYQGLNLSSSAVDRIMRGQISIVGSWNSFSAPFPGWEWHQSLNYLAEGQVNYKAIISHTFPLEEAPSIFKSIDQKGILHNKIIFNPWN